MSALIKSIKAFNREISLVSVERHEEGQNNYFTILIGKNGTGKSSILSSICSRFIEHEKFRDFPENAVNTSVRSHDRQFDMVFSLEGTNYTSLESRRTTQALPTDYLSKEFPLPEKIIATTITPFDRFPLPPSLKQNPLDASQSRYRYLGSRSREIFNARYGQTYRIIESLVLATKKKTEDLSRLVHVFELLNLEPRLNLKYRLDIKKRNAEIIVNSSAIEGLEKAILDTVLSKTGRSRFSNMSEADYFRIQNSLRILGTAGSARPEIEIDFRDASFIRGSLEFFEAISTLRDFGLVRTTKFSILHRVSRDGAIDISSASSGQQSIFLTFLGIASEISDNSVVLLDEPEISLHPEWQEKLLPLLAKTFEHYKGCHFIIATHSPLLLSNINDVSGSVVETETGHALPIVEYAKRSADYQLATVFQAPGFRNEYIARLALSALDQLRPGEQSQSFGEKWKFLQSTRDLLADGDPVADIIDSINLFLKKDES